MQIEKFCHNGKNFEIRIISDGETVYVKAFINDKPANQFRYSATLDNILDMATLTGTDAVKHLIEMAKQDVIRGL